MPKKSRPKLAHPRATRLEGEKNCGGERPSI